MRWWSELQRQPQDLRGRAGGAQGSPHSECIPEEGAQRVEEEGGVEGEQGGEESGSETTYQYTTTFTSKGAPTEDSGTALRESGMGRLGKVAMGKDYIQEANDVAIRVWKQGQNITTAGPIRLVHRWSRRLIRC